MNTAFKQVKMIWAAMLATAFAFVLLTELLKPMQKPLTPVVFGIVAFLTLWMLFGLPRLRRKLILRAAESVRVNSDDEVAIRRWRAGQLLTYAMGEAVMLYGLVLRFNGASTVQVAPWYVVGIGALLVYRPKPLA